MTIATDFSVTATGDIRHIANTDHYTVLDLHRWLQDLADNQETAGGSDDVLDITRATPSERSTDEIVTLLGTYNVDDDAAEYFYAGSIRQGSGATETLYSGIRILGSVVQATTQIQVVQDKGLYNTDAPFWGDQSTGGYNGNAAKNILARFLVKSRVNGVDIDKKKAIVQVRNYEDSYAFFNVDLGQGEAVAAVSSVDDPQNNTAQATVEAYIHVTNTEGFQSIDIGDGSSVQPYYSQWTYGANTSDDRLKAVWEWAKNLTRTGTSDTIHGLDGELFLGVTHSYAYTGLVGTFTEDEEVVWGTSVTYDALAGGTFTVGSYVRFSGNGAAGRIMWDNGTTDFKVALEDITKTVADGQTITEYDKTTGVTGVTATVNVTITDNDKEGGLGVLLASDVSGSKHHLQVRVGNAPVSTLEVIGLSSDATADVSGAPIARTVTPTYLGSYVGTLIGGYGVGVKPSDLTASDTVTDLDGDINTPPNNVTWTLSGVVSGDRILVGPKDTGNAFKFTQMTLTTALAGATETAVVVNAIPANTPAAGTLRIELDDGRYRYQAYTSHNGTDTFVIASTSYVDPDDAIGGAVNGVMVSYLDLVADDTSEAFGTIYTTGPLALWVRVRYGDAAAPIKTYEGQSSLGGTGGSATASRISDA